MRRLAFSALAVLIAALALRVVAELYGVEVHKYGATLPEAPQPVAEGPCSGVPRTSAWGVDGRIAFEAAEGAGLGRKTMEAVRVAACKLDYWGAVAVTRGAPIDSIFALGNFNGPDAAAHAALRACGAAVGGAVTCIVAARVRPRVTQPPDLMLSAAGTWMYRHYYLRARGSRAFAYSPSTRAIGEAEGHNVVHEALEQCRKGGSARPGEARCIRKAHGIRQCSNGWAGAVDCVLLRRD